MCGGGIRGMESCKCVESERVRWVRNEVRHANTTSTRKRERNCEGAKGRKTRSIMGIEIERENDRESAIERECVRE